MRMWDLGTLQYTGMGCDHVSHPPYPGTAPRALPVLSCARRNGSLGPALCAGGGVCVPNRVRGTVASRRVLEAEDGVSLGGQVR